MKIVFGIVSISYTASQEFTFDFIVNCFAILTNIVSFILGYVMQAFTWFLEADHSIAALFWTIPHLETHIQYENKK